MKTIIISIGTALVIIFLGYWAYSQFLDPTVNQLSDLYIRDDCIDAKPDGPWDSVVACYGTVSIEQSWDISEFSIKDNLKNKTIVFVNKLDVIHVVEDKIYTIGSTQFSIDDNKPTNFYFVIDVSSGDFKKYSSLEEIPDLEKPIFSELENDLAKNEK